MEDLKWLVTSKFLAKPAVAAMSFLGSLLYLKIRESVDDDFLRSHCLHCWLWEGQRGIKGGTFLRLIPKSDTNFAHLSN